MDSFLLKNKSEFAKTISKSKLMERTFEKNKMPIRVNLKPKNNLIYNDIAPNKEKTKEIMSNYFKPNLSQKIIDPSKKFYKDLINSNINRKVISLNNNSINNNINYEIEKKIPVKNPVMNVLKYTFETNNKKNLINHQNKKSSLNITNENNDKINYLYEEYNNNKKNKHHQISSSMEINDINYLNNDFNNNNHKRQSSYFEEDGFFEENNFNVSPVQLYKNQIPIKENKLKFKEKYNNNIINSISNNYTNNDDTNDNISNKRSKNSFITDISNSNISHLTDNNSMKNILSKKIVLPINTIKNFSTPITKDNNYALSERKEKNLMNSNSSININPKRNNSKENFTISEDENEESNHNDEKNDVVTITIRIEDLIVLEEKFSNILLSFKNITQLKKFCIEWYTFYNYSSFYNSFENFFSDSHTKEKLIAHEYSVLEFLSVIVVHEILKDNKISESTLNCLNKLIYLVNQNFLIACDYIISILPSYAKKSDWVQKLNIILDKKKEKKINKNQHLDLLKSGNNNISFLMKNILRLYQSNNKVNGNDLIFYLSRSSRIYINTLNEYFKKKVNLEEYNIKPKDYLKNGISSKNNINNNKSPLLKNKKDKKKRFTLVLDLDETIISFQKGKFIPRPGLNTFLNEINKIYEIILFTSATQFYADPILDSIDKNNIYFEKRLYRQHTVLINDTFVKDLSKLGRDLSKVVILDNRPQSYELQKENGIYIKSFYGDDQYDNALINLIPILKTIAKNPYNDVRKEIKKLREEIFTKVTTDLYNGNYMFI